MANLAYPMINGNRFDYSSVEIQVNGIPFRGVPSINYKHRAQPKKIYGTSAMPLGRTRGQYEADGGMEVYKEDYDLVIAAIIALGLGGYGEANFTIFVSYQEPLAGSLTSDTLIGCRIIGDEDSHKQGDDSSIVKVDLDIMALLRNGKPLLNPATTLK